MAEKKANGGRVVGIPGGRDVDLVYTVNGTVQINIIDTQAGVVRSVFVQPSELAEVLNNLPGFSVKYTPPIVVPSYLGAVVERIEESRGSHHYAARWTRYAKDGDTSLPWVSHHGRTVSNDDVAAVLANGGYERQPEFPRNGETE